MLGAPGSSVLVGINRLFSGDENGSFQGIRFHRKEGYVLHLQQGMNLSNSCGQDGTLIFRVGGGIRLGLGDGRVKNQVKISKIFLFSIYILFKWHICVFYVVPGIRNVQDVFLEFRI